MVGSVLPLAHSTTRSRGRLIIALHAVGSTAGGLVVGCLMGLLGAWVLPEGGPWQSLCLAIAAAAYALADADVIRVPRPQLNRQVPNVWRWRFPPSMASLMYGIGLGVGVATHIPFASLYVVAASAVLSGDVLGGGAIMALYGFARSLPLVWFWRTGQRTGEDLAESLPNLWASRSSAAITSSLSQALLSGLLLGAVFT